MAYTKAEGAGRGLPMLVSDLALRIQIAPCKQAEDDHVFAFVTEMAFGFLLVMPLERLLAAGVGGGLGTSSVGAGPRAHGQPAPTGRSRPCLDPELPATLLQTGCRSLCPPRFSSPPRDCPPSCISCLGHMVLLSTELPEPGIL